MRHTQFYAPKSSGCIKLGVSCTLYMPCALGPRHTVIITVKSQVKESHVISLRLPNLMQTVLGINFD